MWPAASCRRSVEEVEHARRSFQMRSPLAARQVCTL